MVTNSGSTGFCHNQSSDSSVQCSENSINLPNKPPKRKYAKGIIAYFTYIGVQYKVVRYTINATSSFFRTCDSSGDVLSNYLTNSRNKPVKGQVVTILNLIPNSNIM